MIIFLIFLSTNIKKFKSSTFPDTLRISLKIWTLNGSSTRISSLTSTIWKNKTIPTQMSSLMSTWKLERGMSSLNNFTLSLVYFNCQFRIGKDEEPFGASLTTPLGAKKETKVKEDPSPVKSATPEVTAKPEKKLGTPYIEVTPAQEEVKPTRKLANLVTSWGPGVAKLKKTGPGQGAAATSGPVKTRTSPRQGPKLPPKSENAVRQQQSGELHYHRLGHI